MGKRVTKFEADLRAAFSHVDPFSVGLSLKLIRAHHAGDRETLDDLLEQIPAVDSLRRQCFNPPGRHYSLMTALDALLKTHGSEALGKVHVHDGPPFEYLNVGDPYVATLVWYRSSGRFYVRCYGDIVEAYRLK